MRIKTRMLLWTLVALMAASDLHATTMQVSNRVVVLVDASLSFRSRVDEAIKATASLLDSMAQVHLHRWDVSRDTITIISLDALPEVVWQGTLRDLKAGDRAAWQKRFLSRGDLSHCTDVGAGFQLAAHELQGDPRLVHKYLFAFTDLINEPPAGSSGGCVPAKRPCPPPAGFPWASLRDVSTSVFWVPVDQKMEWHRAIVQNGVDETFRLFSTSESEAAVITPPPPAHIATTDSEHVQVRSHAIAQGVGVLVWVGGIVLAGMLALIGFLSVSRPGARARQNSTGRPRRPAPPRTGPGPAGAPRPGQPGYRSSTVTRRESGPPQR